MQSSAHRPIELQSPADLLHLESLASSAARAKLDLHLPLSAAPEGGEDALRTEVEARVEQFVTETYVGVKANVSVNGMAWGEVVEVGSGKAGEKEEVEEFEPLDAALASRIRALEAQKMVLTERVADLRRTAPAESARRWQDVFESSSQQLDTEMEGAEQEALQKAVNEGNINLGELQRWDEVRGTWERGLEGLVGLRGGLTETVARLERAKEVVGYLEGK